MTESPIVKAVVWSVDRVAKSAIVVADGAVTTVYPQDGALPEPGYEIACVRNGGDLIPLANSQRVSGTVRGSIEAESFVGTSETTADSWDDPWVWTPLANTTVAQPTEGVDPDPWMRLTRISTNGKVQATITVPLGIDRRYQAVELSAPAAATTGRDCYVRVDFLGPTGSVLSTSLYHLDNLYADPRNIQSPPLLPPPFAVNMKLTVYSEATGLTPGSFMDVRCRAWTVPIFQGGALLDLDGEVLMDHRGLIIGGFPTNEANRTIPLVAGTGTAPPWSSTPSNANTINFPGYSGLSTYRSKMLSGVDCKIKLTIRCNATAPVASIMAFKLPYPSRDHELFNAVYLNSGVAWHIGSAHVDAGQDIVYLLQKDPATNNGNANYQTPFTFGGTDMIIVSGVYEIVS